MIVHVWYAKKMKIYKPFNFDCKYSKAYWQEVKQMTTNLCIKDHVLTYTSLAIK